MVDERDIHGKKQSVERIVERIKEDPGVCPENEEIILEFNEYLKSVRSVKVDRREFYLNKLSRLGRWTNKAFVEMEKEDVKKIQVRIEEKEDYSEWTKHDYLLALRKFFQWLKLRGEDDYSWKSQKYPLIVNGIEISVGKDASRLPTNLPEKKEVEKMLHVCKNSRDKAILMTLFDGGFRVGESLNMKIGDLSQMSRGISIVVHGKTGSRQVLMPMAEPYLNKWLDDHPNSSDGNYLWVNVSNYNYGEPLAYQSLRKRLKILKDRADLSCKVNPHAFRKASAPSSRLPPANTMIGMSLFLSSLKVLKSSRLSIPDVLEPETTPSKSPSSSSFRASLADVAVSTFNLSSFLGRSTSASFRKSGSPSTSRTLISPPPPDHILDGAPHEITP